MALPMLAGGAECGPMNGLQSLTKRSETDRGLQQDFFGPGRAGPSTQTFRTGTGTPGTLDPDAAQFFGGAPASRHSPAPQLMASSSSASAAAAFDMSAMHNTLPPQQQLMGGGGAAGWATDFMQFAGGPQVKPEISIQPEAKVAFQQPQPRQQSLPATPGGMMQWTPTTHSGYRMGPQLAPNYSAGLAQKTTASQPNQIQWEKEFLSQESSLLQPQPQPQLQTQQTPINQNGRDEQDELARAAGFLIESVQNEQNPKFQNSQFLGLMRQLRDREVVVEGNQMVERALSSNGGDSAGVVLGSRIDVKGKGRAIEPMLMDDVGMVSVAGSGEFATVSAFPYASESLERQGDTTTSREKEDANDAYFRQENEDYVKYWNDMRQTTTAEGETAMATPGDLVYDSSPWDHLQKEWDAFEATTVGIKPVNVYQFQDHNPYLMGEEARTRHHLMHSDGLRSSFLENILELEAAVQQDPKNANAWYNLGIKQQEAEREQKAIQALLHAIELDPKHLPTWLALAVSHTNDGNRKETLEAIRKWIRLNAAYEDTVREYFERNPELGEEATIGERFGHLIGCLIDMARRGGGEIDADVQIALAILLNTNEDYGKAQDCFRTALAVRPDDWILYNRVGATMANSGHAQDALQYYYKALELNPTYIRARFNLGISCINLRRYEEAAQHILDALVLQDSDSVQDPNGLNDGRGITSRALWDSLKTTCLHMQRVDLATLCDQKDLEGFRSGFQAYMG